MPDDGPANQPSTSAREAGQSLYEGSLDVVMTGIAIIVPLVITLYVLQIALQFVTDALTPFVDLLEWVGLIQWIQSVTLIRLLIDLQLYPVVIDFLSEIIAVLVLFGVVILVGFVGHHRHGERVIGYVDLAIASIPGVGTVYKSFRRMGDVMLDDEAENFQDIKLVEFFGDEQYVLGFETSTSPESVQQATGDDEMVTMFIPLAPNPVTGGFLTHVPRSQVVDLDMTIEEGVRSILTSGVAAGEDADDPTNVTMGDLEKVTDFERLQDAISADDSGHESDGDPETE
ncbi:DUF502 domain-containing protein [Halobacteriaceae archaeon GCM10025711]